jgi:hypothetical protein
MATLVGDELEAWDRIVARFHDFSIEQSVAYLAPRVGRNRLCGLLIRHEGTGEVAGAALVALAVTPLVPRGTAFIKFGPLWRPGGQPPSMHMLTGVLAAIRDELASRHRLLVRLFPPPDAEYEGEWEYSLAAAGYRTGRSEPDPDRYFVDLRLSEAEQLASLGKDWRSNLRKASAELDVEEVDPKATLGRFMGLYAAMWERKRYSDRHNIEMLSQIVATAPPEFRLRMFMTFAQGEPVAATIVVGPGERIFVMYGASSDAALKVRAGYALRWWMVNALRGSGSRWLDLGGAEGDEGLRHFKEGLSGKNGWVALNGAERYCGSDPASALLGMGVDAARNTFHRLEALGPASGSGLWRRLARVTARRPAR